MITVVNKYKHTPTEFDFYIGRGSALGNPFTSIKDRKTKADFICDSREESIEKYKDYLIQKIYEKAPVITNELNKIWKANKNNDVFLVCYCSPKSCHGDVIKKAIENSTQIAKFIKEAKEKVQFFD